MGYGKKGGKKSKGKAKKEKGKINLKCVTIKNESILIKIAKCDEQIFETLNRKRNFGEIKGISNNLFDLLKLEFLSKTKRKNLTTGEYDCNSALKR